MEMRVKSSTKMGCSLGRCVEQIVVVSGIIPLQRTIQHRRMAVTPIKSTIVLNFHT